MTDLLNPPPIRTPLQDGDSVDPTAKEWYYFWRNETNQINANSIKLDGLVTSGTHANRPDADTMPEGALYVESDRGVIYQNQGGNWHYLAGSMWGTVSPDQRPTDLGVYDAGFDFRGTDQAREFIWSQTAWVEATEVYYGTHALRPASSAVADGVMYVETDRGNVIYQQQANAWVYVAGIMDGTFSPDQRPAGLGTNDTGFRFEATDTLHTYRWSGSAWVDMTPAAPTGDVQIAYATGNITLTTVSTDIPGCSITLNRAGRYLIHGIFDTTLNGAGDQGNYLLGVLNANGVDLSSTQSTAFIMISTTGVKVQLAQQWIYTATAAGQVVKLRGWKTGGTGTSTIEVRSSISALWVSP